MHCLWRIVLFVPEWAFVFNFIFFLSYGFSTYAVTDFLYDYGILIIDQHTTNLVASKLVSIALLRFSAFGFDLAWCIFGHFALSTTCVYLFANIYHFLQLLLHQIQRRFVLVFCFVFELLLLLALGSYFELLAITLSFRTIHVLFLTTWVPHCLSLAGAWCSKLFLEDVG